MANYREDVNYTFTGTYGNQPEGEDDVYTLEEFRENVECGAFIDSDGLGHPVKGRKSDPSIIIKPSRLHEIPEDATHIVWYNN